MAPLCLLPLQKSGYHVAQSPHQESHCWHGLSVLAQGAPVNRHAYRQDIQGVSGTFQEPGLIRSCTYIDRSASTILAGVVSSAHVRRRALGGGTRP